MIDDLDRTLVQLLQLELGAPLSFDVSFAIPDKSFTPVSKQRNTLNCYLYDVREHRELRDTAPHLAYRPGGTYSLNRPPCRVKASYCITAWSPADVTPGVDPHLDEHNLLATVLRALLRHAELPASVLVGTLIGQQPPLPTMIAQPDSARNSGDFWNAIDGQLRPSLEYSITLSLDYYPLETGPLVTSMQTRVGEREPGVLRLAGSREDWYAVGGSVWSSAVPDTAVPDAWVRVDQTGEVSVADAMGHYVLNLITPGAYTAKVRATGFKEGNLALQVPNTAGSYDVTLDPL
jgi:uncharacterized protein DUF4255